MKKQTIIIPEVKIKLLGSIFPEKIYFDGERCKTPGLTICLALSSTKPCTYKDRKKVESPEKI